MVNNNLDKWHFQIAYIEMVNGVGTGTFTGVTPTTIAIATNNQGNNYYVTRTAPGTNTITIYLDSGVNGIMTFNVLYKNT